MDADTALKYHIQEALAKIPQADFAGAAQKLLKTLGYRSERVPPGQSGLVDDFVATYPPITKRQNKKTTKSERSFIEHAQSVRILFQVTDSEMGDVLLHDESQVGFNKDTEGSFLFVIVELKKREGGYQRAKYAEFTQEINKRLRAPAVILFKTSDDLLTLAFVHRRSHKRDCSRDVLGSVSLVREINTTGPHRAHLNILSDLSLENRLRWIETKNQSRNFHGLLASWLDALDTEVLTSKFYKELFEWFKRAVEESRLPVEEMKAEEQVIRFITRILFVWFVKEKGLVAEELFSEEQIRKYLKDYDSEYGDSYYRAVLQNLFFAVLNTEIDKRSFSTVNHKTHRDPSYYRYRNEIDDVDGLLQLFDRIPFINGGLFDCLDSFENVGAGGSRIDYFTDNVNNKERREYKKLSYPNRLFFDDNGLFRLFERYKFTIEENTPIEREVALDPELMGKAFENLLAAYNPETRETARKQTGSYYTPTPVVEYMVDEVLVEALATKAQPADGHEDWWRDRLRYLLDYEDACNDAEELFEIPERYNLIRAVSGITVIDPAVGSGAFPMGMLHKLTLVLRRLDPDNSRWQAIQKEIALGKADEVFDKDDPDEREKQLAEINNIFQLYRDSDFGRKLYLIQNSIFGVDVQAIACQIAKLRFFISLAIEQEPTDNREDNYGIKPLPNLETRFIAADTLIGLERPQQELQTPAVSQLVQEVAKNREHYFHANTRDLKWEYRKRDEKLRHQLANALQESGFSSDTSEKIASWDPYDQNTSAKWFDPEYMFDVKDGFDIVIGNPPYVESRNSLLSSDLKDVYSSQTIRDWNEPLPRGSDLLIYFYARSVTFMNDWGFGCFITQNSWLSTDYGQKFQRFSLGKFSFHKIIDSSGKFFPDKISQNINTIITLFSRRKIVNIEYGVVDDMMVMMPNQTFKSKQRMKWGHIIAMPEFAVNILENIFARFPAKSFISFGQGLNFPRCELNVPRATIPIINNQAMFVADRTDNFIANVTRKRQYKIPALIMPRGIGNKYYCTFNFMGAFSYSGVEVYLPSELWGSDWHYCLWMYLNSSLAWLYREATGRKNLGGGLLKAEATDMKNFPINLEPGFVDEAKEVLDRLRLREPFPIQDELFTDEHLFIDDVISNYFGFSDLQDRVRDVLVEQVNFRIARAK